VIDYEEILKEQELREKNQSKKKVAPGRMKEKQVEQIQPKKRWRHGKNSERQAGIREFAELRLVIIALLSHSK